MVALALAACTPSSMPATSPPAPPSPAPCPPAACSEPAAVDGPADVAAINDVVDGWHEAAARADEQRYFAHMSDDAVFMGTDASERWDKAAFQIYAHPHFAKGKAWSFRASRRAVMLSNDGSLAWFDEDLVTPNLGPARGSGVLRKQGEDWRIVHYNLTITVPNERFKEVKTLLETPALAAPGEAPGKAQPSSGKSSN
jgi:ketosteroid isomerase-like protein